MKLDSVYNLHRVQLAWAQVRPNSGATAIGIAELSGQSRAMIKIYTAQMKCLSGVIAYIPNSMGSPSPKRERQDLPGEICRECPSVANCIILSIAKGELNVSNLPSGLDERTYYIFPEDMKRDSE